MNAEHKEAAEAAVDRFQETYGAKYPKAVEKLLKDREVLLSHFDFPAEHWIHLRSLRMKLSSMKEASAVNPGAGR